MKRIKTLLRTLIVQIRFNSVYSEYWKYQKVLQMKILLENSLKRIGKNNHLIIIVLWYF